MSARPYSLLIDTVLKRVEGEISVKFDLRALDTFKATLHKPEGMSGFDIVSIERDDVEIFGGFIHQPQALFSSRGRYMPISGFDYTSRLSWFNTPSQSIVDETTAAALALILSETDFAVDVEADVFAYISELINWDTTLEFLLNLDTFSETCLEYDMANEMTDVYRVGSITGIGMMEGRSCFYYDGATQRFYVWDSEGVQIRYHHSPDGVTWTRVVSGENHNSDRWSVAWKDGWVHFFWEDAGGGTDFKRGTIADATGTITWAGGADPWVATLLKAGPYYDDQGDIWIVDDGAIPNSGWESTDNGTTWNNRFTPAANHELWGLAPVGSDGDMWALVLDTVANDLELWLWDRSAGTFTFSSKIDDEDDVDNADIAVDACYNVYVLWRDGNSAYYANNSSGGWKVVNLGTAAFHMFSLSVDGYGNAYVTTSDNASVQIRKYLDDVLQDTYAVGYDTDSLVQTPRMWHQDGIVGFFLQVTDVGIGVLEDGVFILTDPTGLRLNCGAASGYVQSDAITAGGAFNRWGWCLTDGEEIQETEWSVLKAADDSVLVEQLYPNFDMDAAGVPDTETSIKIKIDFDDADSVIYWFSITEMIDAVTLDTDYESCYVGVDKLAKISGGEVWVTYDGTTWTVHLYMRRGEDKSGVVVLKSSTTSEEPDVRPNIRALKEIFDWSDYANCIKVLGGLNGGSRVEADIMDTGAIAEIGDEHWYTHRDNDIITETMAKNVAALELSKRNSVVIRIPVEFVDTSITGLIEIGDTVTLICEWDDPTLDLNGSYRIVRMSRTWGPGGEKVTADFTNKIKAAQYYDYMKKTEDHERWIIE